VVFKVGKENPEKKKRGGGGGKTQRRAEASQEKKIELNSKFKESAFNSKRGIYEIIMKLFLQ